MATAHMQRPYPPIYHPQSSVGQQDQHGRSLYAQPPLGMYAAYPQYSPISSLPPYQQQQQPQHQQHQQHQQHPQHQHPQTQGLMMSPVSAPMPQMPHPQHHQQQHPQQQQHQHQQQQVSPRMKLESRPQTSSSPATNSGAAPGPIPATTPLVVRQDTNGVQWIAFEYSRDRVKMEYTIRCDVENINIETLSQDFKTENCVYPRACCTKDQYRGNRLVYETECNAVGWALAELNPCLRGKRGLIQRAVDSWRNSHQDPRLRSRRVKRMAKANNRKAVAQHTSHLASPPQPQPQQTPQAPLPGLPPHHQPPPPPQQQQQHHQPQHQDGHAHEDVSAQYRQPTTSYDRPAHVFQGAYPPYPAASTATAAEASKRQPDEDDPSQSQTQSQFRDLPEGKRRKFILVEDPQRSCRVRVKVMLDQVDMKEIPDSYRKANSVFPRTYFPVHSPFGLQRRRGDRFLDEDDEAAPAGTVVAGEDCSSEDVTVGRTMVPVPMLDGEASVAVPRLARKKRDREMLLNDMGYRMSWGQSRVFAGRTLFLQRSMDAYRNKMRNSMLTAGHETSEIAPYFETRVGKRRWLERGKKSSSAAAAGEATTEAASPAAVLTTASSRSAEEVE
ncbi:conserved hypothetical protein [Microsporum canis CBS 113480]|uniref:DUF8032 domain-containing protein n=1 Tax=Arthroderma otae (strain ATCC MYA-4605 / CBS 113480) TaxID=554155 RepID=C5FVE0_ARTOC|nr:conserved hypothetical protein [Microsporum canis CBS 113480]EEQ33874.1 conserved hypothetical protein [Microsporum canis CBS 113480]